MSRYLFGQQTGRACLHCSVYTPEDKHISCVLDILSVICNIVISYNQMLFVIFSLKIKCRKRSNFMVRHGFSVVLSISPIVNCCLFEVKVKSMVCARFKLITGFDLQVFFIHIAMSSSGQFIIINAILRKATNNSRPRYTNHFSRFTLYITLLSPNGCCQIVLPSRSQYFLLSTLAIRPIHTTDHELPLQSLLHQILIWSQFIFSPVIFSKLFFLSLLISSFFRSLYLALSISFFSFSLFPSTSQTSSRASKSCGFGCRLSMA